MELSQTQTLKLKITNELRQSIYILQYSTLELVDFIHQQTVENPVLEVKDKQLPGLSSRSTMKSSYGTFTGDPDYNPINHYSVTKVTLRKAFN